MKNEGKVQTSEVGVAGSYINQLMANNSTIPVVGKGATQLHYSDRTCYEVLEVSKDGKTVVLEYLKAKPAKPGLEMGHQDWIFEPTGQTITIKWKYNAWRKVGERIIFTKELLGNGNFSINQLTPEQKAAIYEDDVQPKNVVEGLTRKEITYQKVKMVFGTKDYYYDWEF